MRPNPAPIRWANGWKAEKNSADFLEKLYDLYTQRMKVLAQYEEFGLGEGGKQSAATQNHPRDQHSLREKSQKTQGNKGGGKYWVETWKLQTLAACRVQGRYPQ